MSTFTKQLTAVNDAALAAANAAANAALPADAAPLTDHEYLGKVIDSVLKSYQDQYIRITSGEFVLRFPAAKLATIKAAAAGNEQLAAYLREVETNPYVYTGSTHVRGGIAMLVSAGLLTQAEADVILG
jgi:ABC-type Fe3+ transport system substrate-binding protein